MVDFVDTKFFFVLLSEKFKEEMDEIFEEELRVVSNFFVRIRKVVVINCKGFFIRFKFIDGSDGEDESCLFGEKVVDESMLFDEKIKV